MTSTTTAPATPEPWAVTTLVEDEYGWRLVIAAAHGFGIDPAGASVYLSTWQAARLGLLSSQVCNHVDPGEPCCHPAIDGSQFCTFHSASTAGIAVR